MNLKKELKEIHTQFLKDASPEAKRILNNAAEKLAHQNLKESALKVGDKFPIFKLRNAIGETIFSDDLLREGPLVVNFYRGGWCPYCNLELVGYQEILPEIQNLGAQLVAISPELPDDSLDIIGRHSLKYEVLSDFNNELAKKAGLVFSLSEEMKSLYKGFGIDLVKPQGNKSYELPVPATYVVDESGSIILSYVNIDYTDRLEPEEVLSVL